MSVLYHYTCRHGAPPIRESGTLVPGWRLAGDAKALPVSAQFVWLTDLAPPGHRDALGLSSHMLQCDRMEHAFTVHHGPPAQWWMRVRKRHRELLALELAPGAMPMHWWVSLQPVAILGEWP